MIWRIGDNTIVDVWNVSPHGHYGDWPWRLRVILDTLVGGAGVRRGRTTTTDVHPGDSPDFWRALAADQQNNTIAHENIQ